MSSRRTTAYYGWVLLWAVVVFAMLTKITEHSGWVAPVLMLATAITSVFMVVIGAKVTRQ